MLRGAHRVASLGLDSLEGLHVRLTRNPTTPDERPKSKPEPPFGGPPNRDPPDDLGLPPTGPLPDPFSLPVPRESEELGDPPTGHLPDPFASGEPPIPGGTVQTKPKTDPLPPKLCCCPVKLQVTSTPGSRESMGWHWPYSEDHPRPADYVNMAGHAFTVELVFTMDEHTEYKPCRLSWVETITQNGVSSTADQRVENPQSPVFDHWNRYMDGEDAREDSYGPGRHRILAHDPPGLQLALPDTAREVDATVTASPGCPTCEALTVHWAQSIVITGHRATKSWFTHTGDTLNQGTPARRASHPADDGYENWRREKQARW